MSGGGLWMKSTGFELEKCYWEFFVLRVWLHKVHYYSSGVTNLKINDRI